MLLNLNSVFSLVVKPFKTVIKVLLHGIAFFAPNNYISTIYYIFNSKTLNTSLSFLEVLIQALRLLYLLYYIHKQYNS